MAKKHTPAQYLEEVYGLQPSDLDLTGNFTKAEVDRLATKYGLTRIEDMNLERAKSILKNFTQYNKL
jgi:hypothetical protein